MRRRVEGGNGGEAEKTKPRVWMARDSVAATTMSTLHLALRFMLTRGRWIKIMGIVLRFVQHEEINGRDSSYVRGEKKKGRLDTDRSLPCRPPTKIDLDVLWAKEINTGPRVLCTVSWIIETMCMSTRELYTYLEIK